MTTKEKLVFALYVTTSVAVIAHSGVEIWKTFRTDARDRRLMLRTKKEN